VAPKLHHTAERDDHVDQRRAGIRGPRMSISLHIKDVTAFTFLNDSKSCQAHQATCLPVEYREVVSFAVPCSPVVSIATLHLRSVVFSNLILLSNRFFWSVVAPGRHIGSFGLAFGASLCIGSTHITTLHRIADESRRERSLKILAELEGRRWYICARLFPFDLSPLAYLDHFR
jgi:hypothetical protein